MNLAENYNNFLRNNFSNLGGYDEQDFFKAKMMLAGLFNLFVLNVLNILFVNFNDQQLCLSYSNLTIWVLNFYLTLKLRNIRIPYKVMAIYGPISTSLHALFGGGLYSSYIFWFPVMCLGMSIFLDRNFATMIAVYSMVCITIYAYLQINEKVDFKKEIELIPVYFDYTNLMSVFTMLVLI